MSSSIPRVRLVALSVLVLSLTACATAGPPPCLTLGQWRRELPAADAPRSVTLEALRSEPERAGYVQLEAHLLATSGCGPCPPAAACSPCVSTLSIAEEPAPPVARRVIVKGGCAGLVAGRRYRFLLQLEEGDRQSLGALTNDPRFLHVNLAACEPL
jgi:hypothetical protein